MTLALRGVVYVFFFFQAEDGIRDYKVTGVQTCALPISESGARTAGRVRRSGPRPVRAADRGPAPPGHPGPGLGAWRGGGAGPYRGGRGEIGRASCRERV